MSRIAGTMCFTKGVPPCGQCNRFFITHRHTGKGFTDICGPKPERDRLTIRLVLPDSRR